MLTETARVWRRGFVRALIGIALFASVGGMEQPPGASGLKISIRQETGDGLRVTYDLERSQRALGFNKIRGGYHELFWTIETSGFQLVKKRGQIWIERLDGKRFSNVVVTAAPADRRLSKQYQPISRYGDGGLMVYTGHFWPVSIRGQRLDAVFNFHPLADSKVVTFGEHEPALMDWRSPMNHPSFVYMGPLEPVETVDVMAVVDPDAPQWIIDEFYELTPRAFEHLSKEFGYSLTTKPNLFLAAPLGDEEGRLRFAGDALPGQFQVTLAGAAWNNRTEQALNIFRSSTVHEAVHLWQAPARPVGGEIASWIHEGAADAIAAETLLAINYWDRLEYAKYFVGAREECAKGLKYGSLASAERRYSYRALYACGHVIAEAVSIAEDKPVADFWRALVMQAQNENGYSEDTYFDLVMNRTGDADFVEKLRDFVRTPLANPDREIGRLLATAHNASQTDPLAPTGAR
ncbi:MAG: hypothetical protein AAFX54_09285 [Pseudomonadota bacterium]